MSIPGPLASAVLAVLLASSPVGAHPGLHEQEQKVEADLAASPEDPDRHISLGRVQSEKRAWDAALASYSRASRLGAPADRVALLEGAAYLDAGWPEMAKERFEAILAGSPKNAEAHLGRARAWMQLEHPENAAKDYEVVVATISTLQPGDVLEYRERSWRRGAAKTP